MLLPLNNTESLGTARLQHDPFSDRVYLMKCGAEAPETVIARMGELAETNGYSKLFAKVPAALASPFLDAGFECEAFWKDAGGGLCFLAQFLDARRRVEESPEELGLIVRLARAKAEIPPSRAAVPSFSIRSCTPQDAEEMSHVYREVFASYPFPISDPAYLVETMEEDFAYFAAEADGAIVALASVEYDFATGYAEMSDFATLPGWTGRGCALALLERMEEAPRAGALHAFYTIARARSEGMNIVFARAGFRYAGRLVNNTNISGGIQSMNVWHKPCQPDEIRP